MLTNKFVKGPQPIYSLILFTHLHSIFPSLLLLWGLMHWYSISTPRTEWRLLSL